LPIGYVRPASVAAASALAAAGGRILAGGQSLMPLVNRGDVDDVELIDINRLPGLDAIEARAEGWLEIGALVRLEAARLHPLVRSFQPLLADALAWVGNPAIRRRGTLVGNLVNNAPGAEAAAAAALAGARLVTAEGGTHGLGLLPPGRFATAVRFPAAGLGARAGFYEVQRRFGHICTVGCGVTIAPAGRMDVVFCGLLDAPMLAPAVAEALAAGGGDASLLAALHVDLAGRSPRADMHASADYRLRVAPVLARRARARAEAAP
jgi:carbon-monoxide dehydrogenase medium subunit